MQVGEIQEIVALSDMGEYALLKIKKEVREAKYSSHSYVAVCLKLKPKTTQLQRQKEGVQMIQHLLLTKKRRIRTGVMFTQATQEAI